MADIFLSYKIQDTERAERLVNALEQRGWSVWWDRTIPPGKSFDDVIEEEIARARCVVVLWSKGSIQSDWVKTEADVGKRRGILVPALIDEVSPPLAFSRTQAAKLYDWKNESAHPQLKLLFTAIENTLRGSSASTGESQAMANTVPRARVDDLASRPRRLVPRGLVLAAAILILCLVAIGTLFMRWRDVSPVASSAFEVPPTNSFKEDMVFIPGGTFRMGRNDGPSNERPMHLLTVRPFHIDKTEVDNTEYAAFVRDMNYPPPPDWVGGKPPSGQEGWPVVNVSYFDAYIFAAWRSAREGKTYRIPTEEEWEYAARGGGQELLYPWGNNLPEDYTHYANLNSETPKPPCSYPKSQPWGLCDMVGNVWEWTSSSARLYNDPENPKPYVGFLMVRGGSYKSNESGIPATTATTRAFIIASTKHSVYGFRLVRSP